MIKRIGHGLRLLLVVSLLFSCTRKLTQETVNSEIQQIETVLAEEKKSEISQPTPANTPKPTLVPEMTPSLPEESVVPEKTPVPVTTCTLSVTCEALLENMDKLREEKRQLVPENGMIFQPQIVEFSDGETVFDVMLREMKENKIHFEFVKTSLYDSAYIEGIGNLYEFDCGRHSGWMYRVNGESPTYGCSQYMLKNGDKIEFYYNCDIFAK